MLKVPPELSGIIEQHGFTAAIFADVLGEEVHSVGDIDAVAHTFLFKELFGGPSEIVRLKAFLEGKILPQVYSQGQTHCMLSVTKDGEIVYGLFLVGKLDIVAMYDKVEEACREVENALAQAQ